MKAKFLNSVVMGLILGTIYFGQNDTQQSAKNIMGLFFLVIMFQTMVSMFGVLQVSQPSLPPSFPCFFIF